MKATVFKTNNKNPNNRWCAIIVCTAYDDSSPEGYGPTKEAACEAAWASLLALQTQINELVAKGKPEFEDVT